MTTSAATRAMSSPTTRAPSSIPTTSAALAPPLLFPPSPPPTPFSVTPLSVVGLVVGLVVGFWIEQSGPWMFSRDGSQVGSKLNRSSSILTDPLFASTQSLMTAVTSDALREEVPIILARYVTVSEGPIRQLNSAWLNEAWHWQRMIRLVSRESLIFESLSTPSSACIETHNKHSSLNQYTLVGSLSERKA